MKWRERREEALEVTQIACLCWSHMTLLRITPLNKVAWGELFVNFQEKRGCLVTTHARADHFPDLLVIVQGKWATHYKNTAHTTWALHGVPSLTTMLAACERKSVQLQAHVRYSQKETPRLFSWEFSSNQLAHRESIACNWL